MCHSLGMYINLSAIVLSFYIPWDCHLQLARCQRLASRKPYCCRILSAIHLQVGSRGASIPGQEALESVICDVIKKSLLSISFLGVFFSTSPLIPPFKTYFYDVKLEKFQRLPGQLFLQRAPCLLSKNKIN